MSETIKLVLDFASPEATIENFASVDNALTAQLTAKSAELVDWEIYYDKKRADAELAIRNMPVKTTEGYVAATVDANEDVVGIRRRRDKLRDEVSSIKAAIASLERKHSLFKRWLDNQRPLGLSDR